MNEAPEPFVRSEIGREFCGEKRSEHDALGRAKHISDFVVGPQ